jgi:CRISPR-associated protein Cas1
MQTLYLIEPGLTLRRSGDLLRLESREGVCVGRYFPQSVQQVFVFGDVQLTTAALKYLSSHHIPVVFLARTGRFLGRLTGPTQGTPTLRRAQYGAMGREEWAVESARAVVRSKLLAQRQMLLRHRRNHGHLHLEEPLEALQDLRRQARAAEEIKALRGVEGKGSAVYFRAFRRLLAEHWDFTRRERRPPPDPINALLSFAYSLLRAEVEGQLEGLGLDPRVGFLHVERAGRPALALDMMEEFRVPAADRLVLRCLGLEIVHAGDFEYREDGGCWLNREARGRYVRQYQRAMEAPYRLRDGRRVNLRRHLHLQARELVEAIREDRPYRPHEQRRS